MRRLAAILAVLACLAVPAEAGGQVATVDAEPVATGLDFPAAFTFAGDGRIFYGERFTGEIRILNPTTGVDTLFFTISNLSTAGEQGLLGLALHPRYPTVPKVYAYATRVVGGQTLNQILVMRDTGGGTATSAKVIFSSETVAGAYHEGGRILFGPDKMLYAVVGDAHHQANAQNLSTTAGKILRMTAAGKVPAGNPFPGSLVWAYGIRNSYGFDFDPVNKNLWESENGPACNDELNRIVAGGNYAWGPSQTCSTPPAPPTNTNRDGPNPILPVAFHTPTKAPTGLDFCAGCDLPGGEGALFLGEFNTGDIRRVTLTANRQGVASQPVVYSHPNGILSMETGPDGTIYFSDASGIWRLVPA
ncbi:hypothetical protein BH18ACT4_BH18ACT4_00520 [soil metagenome]